MSSVDAVLIEWGKWSRGGVGGLTARSSVWGGKSGRAPDISDDMALRVDASVIALGVENIILRGVIELSYIRELSVMEIGERLRVDRRVVDKYLAEGRGFISGHLSAISHAA